MAQIIHISEAASMALHTMVYLADNQDRRVTTAEIASAIHGSAAHLAKVIQRLARAGLVQATRGPKGGTTLAKEPKDITLLEVFTAIEGPLEECGCLLGTPVCGGNCILGDLLSRVQKEAAAYLGSKTLADFPPVFARRLA